MNNYHLLIIYKSLIISINMSITIGITISIPIISTVIRLIHTVDGWNPAPVGRWLTSPDKSHYSPGVSSSNPKSFQLVQDFATIHRIALH